ncbi:hypothetical protein LEMLEM_LOCUS27653 [Lemmus lemmus]
MATSLLRHFVTAAESISGNSPASASYKSDTASRIFASSSRRDYARGNSMEELTASASKLLRGMYMMGGEGAEI